MASGFEDIVVGVAGTGMMGQAHAYRWSMGPGRAEEQPQGCHALEQPDCAAFSQS